MRYIKVETKEKLLKLVTIQTAIKHAKTELINKIAKETGKQIQKEKSRI